MNLEVDFDNIDFSWACNQFNYDNEVEGHFSLGRAAEGDTARYRRDFTCHLFVSDKGKVSLHIEAVGYWYVAEYTSRELPIAKLVVDLDFSDLMDGTINEEMNTACATVVQKDIRFMDLALYYSGKWGTPLAEVFDRLMRGQDPVLGELVALSSRSPVMWW